MEAMPGSPAFVCQEMSMGFINHGSHLIATKIPSSGRGFAAVDPERQREIDVEHARMINRREDPAQRIRRPVTPDWSTTQRDPADEGGSVRRSR
jgi:hypothetical protein